MLIKNNNPYNINKDIDNPNLIFWYKYKYWKKIGLHTHTHKHIYIYILQFSHKNLFPLDLEGRVFLDEFFFFKCFYS